MKFDQSGLTSWMERNKVCALACVYVSVSACVCACVSVLRASAFFIYMCEGSMLYACICYSACVWVCVLSVWDRERDQDTEKGFGSIFVQTLASSHQEVNLNDNRNFYDHLLSHSLTFLLSLPPTSLSPLSPLFLISNSQFQSQLSKIIWRIKRASKKHDDVQPNPSFDWNRLKKNGVKE